MANIDGTAIAKAVRADISQRIEGLKTQYPGTLPKLVIIQVGDRKDSTTYINMKKKAAAEANIACDILKFAADIPQQSLLNEIDSLNEDGSVHGILVQLPLPDHLDERAVTNAVAANKDVDGFGTENIGELSKRGGQPEFLPCTPKGILHLLKVTGVELSGKCVVVLGRSDIVGSPVAALLRNENATVIVLHSKSQNVPELVKLADVVVAAIGQPEYVKGEWLKQGAVVIDVGTNFVDDASKAKGYRLVGDVDFASAEPVASHITPVPGGVGPMTVAMLLENVYIACERAVKAENAPRKTVPLPLELLTPVPSDVEISRAQKPKKITQVAEEMGLLPSEVEPYGDVKAKVRLSVLDRLKDRPNGKYVLVAGITPTPLGEGKSTTTVGLAQALGAHLGKLTFANVRQPSMGPTFGIKGGAAGGGYSQVIPMDEFNLHVTGDIHAIGAATNLLAAAIDTRMFHENSQKDGPLYRRLVPTKKGKREFSKVMLKRLAKLGINKTDPNSLDEDEIRRFARLDIDPATITWRRVVDCNDRMLRGVTVGQAPTEKGQTRETGFDITVASECMAVLTLSTSLSDMRERLGNMVVASSKQGEPITADDIGCGGALAALMKDAIKPNIMQTLEGTPVFVHAGPFANISIGANSVLADKIALKLAGGANDGYVITEAGFDFTMGGERFLNIKCRTSGLSPDVVVLVATVRALKLHGGGPDVTPGAALPEVYTEENVDLLRAGCVNLAKQIENVRQYGLPVVVAINRMASDSDAEHAVIREEALKAGATDAIVSNHWAEGGKGAVALAEGVVKAASAPKNEQFHFLYDAEGLSPEEKLNAIAQKMYGAARVELSPLAREKIDTYTRQGFGNLPICVAKTQYSLSHDPALKGRPEGFVVPIRDVRASVGAGYLYALAAEIMTIPGLPTHPGFLNIEVKEDGEIEGMF